MDGRLSLNVAYGYEARKQVLGELLNSGVVALDESRLRLGILTEFNGLSKGLEEGSPEAWELVDLFPKKSRKFDPDSDLLNEIVGYMIDNPQTMSYFVTKRIDQTNLILSVNNE